MMSNPNYQPPETAGFWSEDLPPQKTYQASEHGIPYNVVELRTALFPTTPGKTRIGSAQLTVRVENLSADPFSPDFFSSFFGRGEERTLRTEPVAITVKPLPDPKPAGFKGAVGRYSISANLDKDTVAAGQPLTLSVTVAGQGNIKSLPELDWPTFTNFRTFDANAATNIEKKDYRVSGSKVFKTVLIPTTSGDLRIPPVSFVYFDPETHAYKTLTTRAFTAHVTPGAAGAASDIRGSGGQVPGGLTPSVTPGIQRLADDIRYIRTPSNISSQHVPLYRQTWFVALHVLTFIGVLGLGLYRLVMTLFFSNERQQRFKSASARALSRRGASETAESLSDSLRGYIADKLGLDERGLGLKEALQELKNRGVDDHKGQKIRTLWETLDLYQFAPTQVRADELKKASDTLGHIIEELEKEMEWTG